jgi:hypothetical protein
MTNQSDDKKGRSRLLLKVVGGALVIMLALGAGVAYLLLRSPLKSDATLISEFQSHHAEFDRLLQMAREDGGTSLRHITVEPLQYDLRDEILLQGIPRERIEEYRRLMRQANVYSIGIGARRDTNFVSYVSFRSSSAWAWGLVGAVKGWWWEPNHNSGPVYPQLDSLHGQERTSGGALGYRHLEGDWYLFYSGHSGSTSDCQACQ